MTHNPRRPGIAADFVPVIVIGAGPTGMTAATMLAEQGIRRLCWSAMRPFIRCRGRWTPTTRSTASEPDWASATSSPPTAGPGLVFD